jgi:hypothetical protein
VNRAGQVDPSGFAELVGEVVYTTAFLAFSRTRRRLRSLRRPSSSIGSMTSTHQSSLATSSSRTCCAATEEIAVLIQQTRGDVPDLFAQPLGLGVTFQLRELAARHEHVEAFGVLSRPWVVHHPRETKTTTAEFSDSLG